MKQQQVQPFYPVDNHVEQICEMGCDNVNRVIALIEQGQVPEELANLPIEYRQTLMTELKSIMAVYDAAREEVSK
jgi:hypothetical protein